MTAALASLPWVELRSIRADRRTQQVRFAVTDRTRFAYDKVRDAIAAAGYRRVVLLTPPTER